MRNTDVIQKRDSLLRQINAIEEFYYRLEDQGTLTPKRAQELEHEISILEKALRATYYRRKRA